MSLCLRLGHLPLEKMSQVTTKSLLRRCLGALPTYDAVASVSVWELTAVGARTDTLPLMNCR